MSQYASGTTHINNDNSGRVWCYRQTKNYPRGLAEFWSEQGYGDPLDEDCYDPTPQWIESDYTNEELDNTTEFKVVC